MSKFLKSLLLSFIIFLLSLAVALVYTLSFEGNDYGYYGLWGGMLFYFFVAFWAYWFLAFIYITIVNDSHNRIKRYLIALGIICIGYIFSRTPDIIDKDFIESFKWQGFIFFLSITPVIVEIEYWLSRKI